MNSLPCFCLVYLFYSISILYQLLNTNNSYTVTWSLVFQSYILEASGRSSVSSFPISGYFCIISAPTVTPLGLGLFLLNNNHLFAHNSMVLSSI